MTWYDNKLRNIESKGSRADRPGSLAGLAAARRVHQGQFFTPDSVAALMWNIVRPAMDAARRKVSILDNSIGSGRLIQFASPDKHALYGVDVDGDTLGLLGTAAEKAGFTCEFVACGMESARPKHFDVGLINPPFSLHIESPLLKAYPCNAYGRFGPSTSTLSHAYALAQAVDACQVVVALLPSPFAADVAEKPAEYLREDDVPRLRVRIDLPAGLFRDEGTDVRVSLLVLGSSPQGFVSLKLNSLSDPVPDFGLRLPLDATPKLRVLELTDDEPAITRPVTGNTTVRVAHNSRKVILGFRCGLTEAKVLNAVYRKRVHEETDIDHRRPKGFRYCGQGALDMEVHLAQDDPETSFDALLNDIRKGGGNPVVDPGLVNYLRKRRRRSARQATPLRHTIFVPDGVAGDYAVVEGRSRKARVANPKVWGSPVIAADSLITFHRQSNGQYSYELEGQPFSITPEDLYKDFDVEKGAANSGWNVVHEGLIKKFPRIVSSLEARATALGIGTWLTWSFQMEDLIETAMKPSGCVVAWEPGLGKARLASALITLIGCKRGLIVVEAGLLDEMIIELRGLPIPPEEWQIITTPEQTRKLRRINVISYERLRMPIHPACQRRTYARLLRRRIGILVADEGDVLANPESLQSRALYQVSARRKFILSGTPITSYPRDILPIMAFACGDGTAAQPWGWRRGFLEENWRQSVAYAQRGIDAFRTTFVTTEWVTQKFEDDLLTGAKREVPKISNVEAFRAMIAPHVKRRVTKEPEVAKHIVIPPETRSIMEVPWDNAHLAHYLRVADEFASWYMRQRDDNRQNNLIALLARIRAVSFACDYPQHQVSGFGAYASLTSKQRWVLDELEALADEGKKTILYAENPGQLDLLGQHLAQRGVESVIFHGNKPIRVRTKELHDRFRFGPVPVLLAGILCTQKGLNIPQASEVILLSRSWLATTEEQAIHRVLRPTQKANVRVRYVHLPGSIDEYKKQVVDWKQDSSDSGLDWATPQKQDVEFVHLDMVITRFCEDLAKLHKVSRRDLRGHLAKEVACV